jgi:hypothetical protein
MFKDVYILSQVVAFGLLHVLNTAIIYEDFISKAMLQVDIEDIHKVKVFAAMMMSAVAPLGVFLLNGVSGYFLLEFDFLVWVLLSTFTLI